MSKSAEHTTPSTTPETTSEERARRQGKGWKRVVAGAALVGVGLTGGFLAKGLGGEPSAAADKDRTPSIGATPTPGDTVETPTETPAVEQGGNVEIEDLQFEISGEEFRDPTARNEARADKFNQLMKAGIYKGVVDSDEFNSYDSIEAYIAATYDSIDNEYFDSIFVSGWRDNPSLVEYSEKHKEALDQSRLLRIISTIGVTDEFESGELEPYERWVDVVSVTNVDNNPLINRIEIQEDDNSELTAVQDRMTGPEIESYSGTSVVEWVEEIGKKDGRPVFKIKNMTIE